MDLGGPCAAQFPGVVGAQGGQVCVMVFNFGLLYIINFGRGHCFLLYIWTYKGS